MTPLRPLFLLLLVFAAPAPAAGTAWHSLAGASSIEWTAHWQGNPVKGSFGKFTIAANGLDAAQPGGAALSMDLDTRSVTASSPDVTQALLGAAWFAVAKHPTAHFKGNLVRRSGHLQAQGRLSLKGHERALSFPVRITSKGKNLLLEGQFTLQRSDFGIGTGQWSSGDTIAEQVEVRFSVLMAPGTAG